MSRVDFDPIIEKDDRTYYCVADQDGLDQLCAEVERSSVVAIDWETTTADMWLPEFEILGLAVAVNTEVGYYIPFNHEPAQQATFFAKTPPKIDFVSVVTKLGPLLETRTVLCHNVKFDISVSKKVGLPYNYSLVEDTYIAAGVTNNTRERAMNLKHLTRTWLGHEALEMHEITGSKKNYNMKYTPIELVTEYAAADACNCLGLWEVEEEKLKRWPRVNELYRKLEMPIVPIVAGMEQRGFLIDRAILEDVRERTVIDAKAALTRLRDIAGYPFDPGRSDHRAHMLYDELCLPVSRKGGKENTERKNLETLFEIMEPDQREKARPFLEAFVAYSKAEKVRSTYNKSIWEKVDQNGRVHPSFFQIDTMTGRMSSGKPINFQNMPRDDELYDIRAAFVPDEGYRFVLADYVQMEFKIGAALSQDAVLVEAANNPDIDVHIKTAAACFRVDESAVTKPQRQAAKTLTYAIQFGATPAGVSKLLNCRIQEAQRLVSAFYNEAYPGLRDWTARVQSEIKRRGYSETYYGRRRWGDINLLQSHIKDQQHGEVRKLVNMIVQGTGADVTKLAMKKVHKWFLDEGLKSQIVGQIHDELVILCPEDEASKVMYFSEELMAHNVLDVNLPVEASIRTSLSKSKDAILAGKG